ncbi:twin-arginine translocation signal domain-containing protein [Luteipulveratus halotolerans]|uniref:twin-arginine translocation signal domain-containing protein n=1 Tax=Luteipulveratus halotolerans TaxID=1631356 RepID=UPI0006812977|nr:twin-arginine translocation signal domain-containing protein [Luteipulveratus halotolerans]
MSELLTSITPSRRSVLLGLGAAGGLAALGASPAMACAAWEVAAHRRDRMTLEQQVGQLFMVGTPAT